MLRNSEQGVGFFVDEFLVARPGGVEVGRSIDEVERELILKTLESTGWNKTQAARILQVTPRTLRNKLGRYRQEGYIGGEQARA